MPRLRRLLAALPFAALALTAAEGARAFCGFYVAGGDAKLFADATQVVLMREGTRTVLSMQNDYKGPPDKFALVIPVPVVLQKENVKVLPPAVFDKIDKLGAPRLVEYWEEDPCASHLRLGEGGGGRGEGIGLGNIGTLGHGAGDLGVKVEAKFTVGEYEIVILSAKDAGGLDTWLRQEKYAIPEGADAYFKPYVASGSKFFVAKVDPAKVKFEGGRAALSPLRFHYDSDKLSLPMRLGLINSSGKQDLVVNVLAKGQRFEAANYPNVTIPTNLDVAESARDKFGEFYAALYDDTLAKNPRAVVTEYAWDPGTCDPCPGPTLDGDDLATLGADVITNGTAGLSGGGGSGGTGSAALVQLGAPTVSGKLPPEVIQRIVRQNFGRIRACYNAGLRTNPTLGGKMETRFTIDKTGAVSKVADTSTLADATTRQCVTKAFSSLSFPQPEGGPVDVTYPIVFAPTGGQPTGLASIGSFGTRATSYVLTRLHLRYDKDSLGEDLVLKAAPPIAGGREQPAAGGGLERGAQPGTINNFQGRYAIRHPWTGPIACKDPVRGRWGGPPAGVAAPTAPAAAQKTAFSPRGAALASFFGAGGLAAADLGAKPGNPAPSSAPSAAPSASAAPSSSSTATDKPEKKGCATTDGSPTGALALGLATALVLAARARRRR